MRYLLKISALFLLLLGNISGFSQEDVLIFGAVRESELHKKVAGVTITIYQDGTKYNTIKTNSSGKYELILNFDHDYKVVYSYPEYATKFLTFNLKDIPDISKEGGREINIDMELPRKIEGVDYSLLDNPIGKFEYNPSSMELNYNKEYTKQMQAQLAALMREHNRRLKEDAERKERMEQEFKGLVRKGDDAVRNKKYSDGVDFYTDALVLFPDDESVQNKKSDAELEVANLLALKGKEDKYNQFIKTGDSYFSNEEWENALSSFESAVEIFPTESYPKNRIIEINRKLEDIRNNATKLANVDKLIKEGDALVAQEDFDDGISKYTESLALIAGHKLATEQLAIAKEKKKAWMLGQEKEVNFSNLLAQADEQFNTNDYKKSITTYKAALKIKPNESYPNEQISKAEGFIAEASANREKRTDFNLLVSEGDGRVNAKAYQEGIDKYNEALVLYPDDSEVANKIRKAEASMASLLAAGEIDKRYLEAITSGDNYLGNKDYEAAKYSYQEALTLKENEAYPKRKLDDIDGILAGLAASELALAKKSQQDQFDNLVREGDENSINADYNNAISKYEAALVIIAGDAIVLEKIENAKRRRKDLLASKEIDEQYDEVIARADREFDIESYEDSKNDYKSALEIKSDDYPRQRIAEIDLLLLELANKMDEGKRMEEFLQLEKEGDAFVNDEDYSGGITSYEAALMMFPDENRVIDKKLKAERKLAEMNADLAMDDQYNNYISKADLAFSEKNYNASRSFYQKAFAAIAKDYPKNRIKEIDRLILENERRSAEEEAARLASVKIKREWNDNSSDVDRYIEEAEENRKRSQSDKYAELLAYKRAVKQTNSEYSQNGETLRNENYSTIVAERQGKKNTSDEGEMYHDNNVNKAQDESETYAQWLKRKSDAQKLASRDYYAEIVDKRDTYNMEYSIKSEAYKEYSNEVIAEKETQQNKVYVNTQDHQRKIKDNYYQSQELAAEQYRLFSDKNEAYKENVKDVQYEKEDVEFYTKKYSENQDAQIESSISEVNDIEDSMKRMSENDVEETKDAYNKLSNENEMREVEVDRWKNSSDLKREQANNEIRGSEYSGKKEDHDYSPGTLANQYQQGITEESYTEGNNQVVKRIVVSANKADEYKMVVTKSGTYYFKNGNSITKNTWNRESSKKSGSLD